MLDSFLRLKIFLWSKMQRCKVWLPKLGVKGSFQWDNSILTKKQRGERNRKKKAVAILHCLTNHLFGAKSNVFFILSKGRDPNRLTFEIKNATLSELCSTRSSRYREWIKYFHNTILSVLNRLRSQKEGTLYCWGVESST